MQQELLPQVRAVTPFSDDAGRTVVAGQSFGGLSALYAGLNWPTRFGCVLSQSGSFWWPHCITPPEGSHYPAENRRIMRARLRIVLEAGVREPIVFQANQALYAQLNTSQQSIFWRQVDGGHDALCWRGGLTQGLMLLWQPLIDTL